MLTQINRRQLKQSPPRIGKQKAQPAPPNPTESFSKASYTEKGISFGKLLASVSALALTAATQSVEAADAISQQAEIELVLSSTRAADTVVDPLLEQKWQTPDQVQGKEGGKLYHYAKGAMAEATAKHVTADSLSPDAPRLTARGVDPNQSSKQYPQGQVGWRLTEPFKECTEFSSDGTCLSTRWESITYKNLSCLYKNETTGETVRVVHRSTNSSDTDQMNRSVCAGHRLVKDSNGFWGPVQTDSRGNTLYVNPLNIVQMEVVSQ